jgi:hypothetical protein
MKTKIKIVIIVIFLVLAVLAWAPWLSNEEAIGLVVAAMGGPDADFHYIGETMPLGEVIKEIAWIPFGRYVTLPGEGWFVTFYSGVVKVVEWG